MALPNDVQQNVIKRMTGYCIIMQWTDGAIMVAPDQRYEEAKVIDTKGEVFGLDSYLSLRDQHAQRRHPRKVL
jgi:hypothetical protein